MKDTTEMASSHSEDIEKGVAGKRAATAQQHAAPPAYFNAYANFACTRTESGVLTVRLHTDGGLVTFTGQTHSDFPRVLDAIAEDRANKVLVLTGTATAS